MALARACGSCWQSPGASLFLRILICRMGYLKNKESFFSTYEVWLRSKVLECSFSSWPTLLQVKDVCFYIPKCTNNWKAVIFLVTHLVAKPDLNYKSINRTPQLYIYTHTLLKTWWVWVDVSFTLRGWVMCSIVYSRTHLAHQRFFRCHGLILSECRPSGSHSDGQWDGSHLGRRWDDHIPLSRPYCPIRASLKWLVWLKYNVVNI